MQCLEEAPVALAYFLVYVVLTFFLLSLLQGNHARQHDSVRLHKKN